MPEPKKKDDDTARKLQAAAQLAKEAMEPKRRPDPPLEEIARRDAMAELKYRKATEAALRDYHPDDPSQYSDMDMAFPEMQSPEDKRYMERMLRADEAYRKRTGKGYGRGHE